MDALEDTGLTPADRGFYAAAARVRDRAGRRAPAQGRRGRRHPARRIADCQSSSRAGRRCARRSASWSNRMVKRYRTRWRTIARQATRASSTTSSARSARSELRDADDTAAGENVFTMMRRIGQAKAGLAADFTAQLAHSAGKVVFFAKHINVMDAAEQVFARRGIGYSSIRGGQTHPSAADEHRLVRQRPNVAVAVCSLTAAGVGLNLQVASNIVLAELSWTAAEQTQAIDRVHRIGQDQPVTAWRVIAAQTMDARIAELINSKAGLAARALDGSDEEVTSVDVQLETLVALLTDTLQELFWTGRGPGFLTVRIAQARGSVLRPVRREGCAP